MKTESKKRPSLAERNKAQRTEVVRREIVDAAVVEFTERGYHGASLTHIAERIGTGPSTIYNYFASKREILDYATDETLAGLAGLITHLSNTLPGSMTEFRERATQFGDAIGELLTSNPRMARMLLIIATTDDASLREKWNVTYTAAVAVLKDFLERGVATGLIRPDVDAQATATAIIAIPFGLVACDPGQLANRDVITASVRAAVAMVAGGIQAVDP